MNRYCFLLIFYLLCAGTVFAQSPADSAVIPKPDSVLQKDPVTVLDSLPARVRNDSVSKRPKPDPGWTMNPSIVISSPEFSRQVLLHHPYFGFNAKPLTPVKENFKQFTGKEILFYLLLFLLVVFALIRRAFPKYFGDLFRLFFRTTIKQRQIREQLMQTPLPSLVLNGFFIVTTGLYITFLLRHFNLAPANMFWWMFLYSCLGLSAAYLVKFVWLKIAGWLFNMSDAADSYIFIVFIVNKMIGILLLPFLVLLAFTTGDIHSISLTLSWCIIGGLIVYRFILTFAAVRNQVKVNPFHFLLYLCAFEIAPLLLVYKGLLQFFNQTA